MTSLKTFLCVTDIIHKLQVFEDCLTVLLSSFVVITLLSQWDEIYIIMAKRWDRLLTCFASFAQLKTKTDGSHLGHFWSNSPVTLGQTWTIAEGAEKEIVYFDLPVHRGSPHKTISLKNITDRHYTFSMSTKRAGSWCALGYPHWSQTAIPPYSELRLRGQNKNTPTTPTDKLYIF